MLNDLTLGPSQVCGAFRLVPLFRPHIRQDLRLNLAKESGVAVDLNTATYIGYIPHALVVRWNTDGTPVASVGTALGKHAKSHAAPGVFHRMAKRRDGRALRFLPLHLAMDGLLAMHFGGPSVQWGYFSREAISRGMSPRVESAAPGWALAGFEEALRVFEIHEGQVGALVFVADALAAAFVTPHPEDYRALHDTLLQDFFGELIWQYAIYYPESPPLAFPITADGVRSLDDLRAGVALMRDEWHAFGRIAATGILDVPVTTEPVYKAGPFTLERFIGSLKPDEENHIGERIVDADGCLQYLKTFRLSANQTRRAYLLKQLADHDWNLDSIANKNRLTANDVMLHYAHAGFGWLFQQHVLDAARAGTRQRSLR